MAEENTGVAPAKDRVIEITDPRTGETRRIVVREGTADPMGTAKSLGRGRGRGTSRAPGNIVDRAGGGEKRAKIVKTLTPREFREALARQEKEQGNG